jgi:hypothetical protein
MPENVFGAIVHFLRDSAIHRKRVYPKCSSVSRFLSKTDKLRFVKVLHVQGQSYEILTRFLKHRSAFLRLLPHGYWFTETSPASS